VAPVLLRPARPSDAEAIRTIYNHEVLTTTATFDLVPRSLDDQQQWLAARSGAFTAIVAVDPDEPEGSVAGFASLSPYKERAAYRTSVEDSVYVRRDRAGQGIGRLLLTELLDVAASSGFHSVFARIEASGTASRALHERCGFRQTPDRCHATPEPSGLTPSGSPTLPTWAPPTPDRCQRP
jgi:L-amino acid N-acyltransferase